MLHLLKRALHLTVRDFAIFNFPLPRKFRNQAYARIFSAKEINVDHRCRIHASHYVAGQSIRFGESPQIGRNMLIDYTGTIKAGQRKAVSDSEVTLTLGHPLSGIAQDWCPEPVQHSRLRIDDDAWIAAKAIVLESVREIGDGSVASYRARMLRTLDYLELV